MQPFRPLPSLRRWREILNFSKWLQVQNILNFAYRRTDSFTVGRFMGAGPLGIYSVAYEISTLAHSELIAPIRRALLPGYTKLAEEPTTLRAIFVESFAIIVLLAAPIGAGIGVTADAVVRLFLGEQWLGAIPLMRIITVFGLLEICSANTFPLYLALGKPRVIAMLVGIGTATGVPALLYATYTWGAVGAACSITIVSAVTLMINLSLALRLVNVSIRTFLANTWRTAVATCVMAVIVTIFLRFCSNSESFYGLAARLAIAVGVGFITYVSSHLVLWHLTGRPDGSEQLVLVAGRRLLNGYRVARGA
jgi:O-antigen/teichoic acid export membrane protein